MLPGNSIFTNKLDLYTEKVWLGRCFTSFVVFLCMALHAKYFLSFTGSCVAGCQSMNSVRNCGAEVLNPEWDGSVRRMSFPRSLLNGKGSDRKYEDGLASRILCFILEEGRRFAPRTLIGGRSHCVIKSAPGWLRIGTICYPNFFFKNLFVEKKKMAAVAIQ